MKRAPRRRQRHAALVEEAVRWLSQHAVPDRGAGVTACLRSAYPDLHEYEVDMLVQ